MRSKGKYIALGAFFTLLIYPSLSLAKINIRTGEYTWGFAIPEHEINIRYSSRSTYVGVFGAGWCSDLDYEETEVGLFHCGRRIRKPPDDLKRRLRQRATLNFEDKRIQQIDDYRFLYEENNLVQIERLTENWKFKYDSYQNLVYISQPHKAKIDVQYDNANDRALQVREGHCRESISYKQSVKKRWVSYQKSCHEQLIDSQNLEITYSRSQTGSPYIKNIKVISPNRSTYIEYSELGEVLSINLTNRKEKS